jgi:ABC-type Fe3+/spermidine/putrescine transport system ATPase subunit
VSVEVSNLSKRFGTTLAVADVSFTVPEGRFLALLGPSGSGKMTVLRMLAGLEQPDGGRTSVHGRVVYGDRRVVPAEERDIGMVFQDYALWPHMTVAQNIAFGLRLRRLSQRERGARVAEALALVRLQGLDERYPDQLSGGQQQRVAIARALATRPGLLLLDEPLSNLDAALREEMRVELVRLLKDQGITAVYVTHDRIEALAMSDQIVVMRTGRVVQIDSPEELYQRPGNTFIAGFMGHANFVPGEVVADADGRPSVQRGALRLRGRVHTEFSGRGVAMLRPEDGALHASAPAPDAANVLEGDVVHSEFLGGRWRHVVAIAPDLTVQVLTPERTPAPRVWLRFPSERCVLLPATDGPDA